MLDSEIAEILKDNSVYVTSQKFGMSPKDLKKYIFKSAKLRKIYKSRNRKNRLFIQKEGIIPERMNCEGCRKLSLAVIKQAIRDKDVYFFESGNYELFQNCVDNGFEKENYLEMIKKGYKGR